MTPELLEKRCTEYFIEEQRYEGSGNNLRGNLQND